jgi:hypothetical protein
MRDVSFRPRFSAPCTQGAMIVSVGFQARTFNRRLIDRFATET